MHIEKDINQRLQMGAWWHSGREHWTPNGEGLGSIPNGGIVLHHLARHINSPKYWLKPMMPYLRTDMTETQYKQTNKGYKTKSGISV